jgi:hypothetical protein
LKAKVYEFPDVKQYEFRRPLSARADARFFPLRINDEAFRGALGRGRIVVIEEGAISLPGFHAVRLASGLMVVRYATELPGERVHLVASNTEYPDLIARASALVGCVRQMEGSVKNQEHWELLNPAALPLILMEWLLSSLSILDF